jgi:hypothetical protein
MALSTYSELQASVADWLHRDDLTSRIPDFIALAEADMQVRAKLSQWEATATVAVTSGSGSLPSDYSQAISVVYGGGPYQLHHLPQRQFHAAAADGESGKPEFFTIQGSNILVVPSWSGDLTLVYTARFTPLSDTATSNSLLSLFPDAYLNGSLMHAANWTQDTESMSKYAGVFEACIRRIRSYMLAYKYPHGLQMRVA